MALQIRKSERVINRAKNPDSEDLSADVRASWNDGDPQTLEAVCETQEGAKEARASLRRAASRMNIGLDTSIIDGTGDDEGKILVVFRAREMRRMVRRTPKPAPVANPDPAETDAKTDEKPAPAAVTGKISFKSGATS